MWAVVTKRQVEEWRQQLSLEWLQSGNYPGARHRCCGYSTHGQDSDLPTALATRVALTYTKPRERSQAEHTVGFHVLTSKTHLWIGLLVTGGKEKVSGGWGYSVSWFGCWWHECVQFLKITQTIPICVCFSTCMLHISIELDLERSYVYWVLAVGQTVCVISFYPHNDPLRWGLSFPLLPHHRGESLLQAQAASTQPSWVLSSCPIHF